MSEPVRLSKRVIELTGCSRAQAERYVESGQVTVDGEVIDRPEFSVTDQRVALNPEAEAVPVEPATLLLHKPAGMSTFATESVAGALGLVTAESRWAEDPSEVRHLRRHLGRLTPVLPLESRASGLQLLTQDGRLVHRMREEGNRIEQEYIVEVSGTIAMYGLHKLGHGVSFDGRVLPPCKVSWQNETRLRFAIKGVRDGQLSSMCEQVGLKLVAARRIRIGRVPLAKMPEAQWRYLPFGERI